jgi:hypothetical protein
VLGEFTANLIVTVVEYGFPSRLPGDHRLLEE